MTLTTSIDKQSLQSVMQTIEELGKNAKQQIHIALGKTAAKVRTKAARKLRTELNAPVRVLKKTIRVQKQTDKEWLAATVLMIAGHKIPLKYFGAKENISKKTKRTTGVSYKINSQNKGKLPHAFVIEKYDRRVYERVGTKRGPLVQQKGPAPGEVYQSSGVVAVALQVAEEELPKQVAERIRFLTLKAQGKLKGNQR